MSFLVAALAACGTSAPRGAPYDPATAEAGTIADETATTEASDPDPDDDSSSSTTDPDADESSTGDDPEPYYGPAPYPAGRIHSPITTFVADTLREIAERNAELRDDVFLKAGASSTVSPSTLFCFADEDVDLGAHADLEPTLAYFLGGDAAGTTPFDRMSLAAESGRSAGWCIDGDPSPLELEVEAIEPRLAFVHYGTNDMGLGATHDAAAYSFYANMTTLLDDLLAQGIVPIVFGITRRGDSDSAQRWVATFNAIIRGLAQTRQVPHVDIFTAIDPLAGHGLSGDGLHLEAFPDGACILTDEGLEHGYNVRNLVSLEVLDRTVAVLVDDAAELDAAAAPPDAAGTSDLPYPVALPFADHRDTTDRIDTISAYPACSDSDESGPEVWYRLELDETTSIRALVLDLEGVDVDIHLLDAGGGPDVCRARDDRLLEGTLDAGTYDIVVDTWSSDATGGPLPGEFLLVVVECEPDDSACAEIL